MHLTGKISLVTGASRGIGKAIAIALARKGAMVIGTATSQEGAEKITNYFASENLKGYGKVLNVTNEQHVQTLLTEIKEEFGAVEILVNNAGITSDNLILRMKDEQWQSVIDTNLTAVFKLTKLCVRDMMKLNQGKVINISSVVGVTGNAGQANYVAAKAGLIGLSKTFALEFASRNITFNVVAPGYIATDMTDKLTEAQKAAILQKVPLGRVGTPEDIAAAVTFLASASADYITGQTIHVNGGMYME